jgi:hypothetical protein
MWLLNTRLTPQNFDDQQTSADDDRAVRQIEHRPLILLEIEEQEVHDPPAGHTIP